MAVLDVAIGSPAPSSVLVRRALRVRQPGRAVFQFTLTASEVLEVADISRISRSLEDRLVGYQRDGVGGHVREIVEYLDGEEVLFPNALILALPSTVRFIKSRGPNVSDGLAEAGNLEIPLTANGRRPAWIVDGQQRALALARCAHPELPVPVTAFVADEVELQRDQFVRINNVRPLPRRLVAELLPAIGSQLGERMAAKRLPSALCDALNVAPESSFQGLIRRSSTATADHKAVVNDTAIVEMIQARLASGCLFPHRNVATDEVDVVSVWALLVGYWSGVQAAFPAAWALPPSKSRLMHGVGIRALGRLMDDVMQGLDPRRRDLADHAAAELQLIEPHCHWTEGAWESLGVAWNGLENTPGHVRLLSNHLVRLYSQAKLS